MHNAASIGNHMDIPSTLEATSEGSWVLDEPGSMVNSWSTSVAKKCFILKKKKHKKSCIISTCITCHPINKDDIGENKSLNPSK